jgi:hypothetical protein
MDGGNISSRIGQLFVTQEPSSGLGRLIAEISARAHTHTHNYTHTRARTHTHTL